MRNLLIVILIIVVSAFQVNAQAISENKTIQKNSISGNILGTGSYLGFSYERLFKQRVSAEIGIGLIGLGTGISYYFRKVEAKKLIPYIGLKYTSHAIVDGEHKKVTYLPVGITYFGKRYFNFGFDIGPAVRRHMSPGYMPTPEELARYPFTDFGVFGNLKLGFRF